jgi:hypothetical protein
LPSLSSGIIKVLLDYSPQHAWMAHPRLNPNHQPARATQFDIGHAAHALMLGHDAKFSVLDFDSYRTKDAQAARDLAYSAGQIPILRGQFDDVNKMVAAGKIQLSGHREAQDAFENGRPEMTIVWKENRDKVAAKARLDWVPDNKLDGVFYDYKTTSASAHPDAARRHLYNIGADVQAAWYLRGLRANGVTADHFRFVVQETEAPYALSVIEFAPAALALAERKVREAIEIWSWCMKTNQWPGYPARVCYIDAPVWEETRIDERAALGTPSELLTLATRMQAP